MRSTSVMLVLAIAGLAACEKSRLDRPASTITYSAKQQSRTADSTGFVDNAGRTSDQHGRSETSGMRATETGSERPTGTPASGTPIPIDPPSHGAQVGEGAGALGGEDATGSGAPGDTVVGRIARARCDRETACDRVGEGKPFATGEQCMASVRGRSRADVVAAQCSRGFDSTQVASCLTSIRQVACDARLDAIENVPHCQSSGLCVP